MRTVRNHGPLWMLGAVLATALMAPPATYAGDLRTAGCADNLETVRPDDPDMVKLKQISQDVRKRITSGCDGPASWQVNRVRESVGAVTFASPFSVSRTPPVIAGGDSSGGGQVPPGVPDGDTPPFVPPGGDNGGDGGQDTGDTGATEGGADDGGTPGASGGGGSGGGGGGGGVLVCGGVSGPDDYDIGIPYPQGSSLPPDTCPIPGAIDTSSSSGSSGSSSSGVDTSSSSSGGTYSATCPNRSSCGPYGPNAEPNPNSTCRQVPNGPCSTDVQGYSEDYVVRYLRGIGYLNGSRTDLERAMNERLPKYWDQIDGIQGKTFTVSANEKSDKIINGQTVAVINSCRYYRGQAAIVKFYDKVAHCVYLTTNNWLTQDCQEMHEGNCYRGSNFNIATDSDCISTANVSYFWTPQPLANETLTLPDVKEVETLAEACNTSPGLTSPPCKSLCEKGYESFVNGASGNK